MKEGVIQGSLNSYGFSANSNQISATTINATNFYGFFDAKYIGTGDTPNWVTNTEVGYLNGLTSNTQTQINTKAEKTNTYLTYEQNQGLVNQLFVTTGENVTISSDTNYYYANIEFASFDVGVVYDTPVPDSSGRVNNYNPTGWDGTYPNKSTIIKITPNSTIFLTGIAGGVSGRICYLTNLSNNLVILPETSTHSEPNNRFQTTYFLRPYKTVKLIYLSSAWSLIERSTTYGMDYADNLKSIDFENGFFGKNFNGRIPSKSDYFTLSGHTSLIGSAPSSTYFAWWRGDSGDRLVFHNLSITDPPTVPATRNNWFWSMSQNTNTSTLKFSGKSNTFIVNIGSSYEGTILQTGLSTTVIGWQNSNNSYGYSAATNGYTKFPNFNGGVFLINDYYFSQSNMIACVQTPDGLNITANTNISLIVASTATKKIGIHTINNSGNSYGISSFFSVTDQLVGATIIHTGLTENSSFGVWGYANQTSTNSLGIVGNLSLNNIAYPSFATDFLR